MVTPAVLRLETEERVVLEAPGLTAPTEATLLVQDFPLKRQVLYQIRMQLSPNEGMLASATVKVCHQPPCHLPAGHCPLPPPGEGGPWRSSQYKMVEELQGAGGTRGRMWSPWGWLI